VNHGWLPEREKRTNERQAILNEASHGPGGVGACGGRDPPRHRQPWPRPHHRRDRGIPVRVSRRPDDEPYIVVQLDDACRRQQVGEGWFASMSQVPQSAISMSIRQILRAKEIICVVPDERKAAPVKAALEGPVTPDVPASALREHGNVTVYLDSASASLLRPDASRMRA